MSDNEFKKGHLAYTAASMTPGELAAIINGSWKDGYVAFATTEKRLSQLPVTMDESFFRERVQGIEDAEGYVSEVNLWRNDATTIEEIAVEREENSFYVQHWLLKTDPVSGTENCWHCEADTKTGSHHNNDKRLFNGSLKSIEVVWPVKRLNFYLTTGAI